MTEDLRVVSVGRRDKMVLLWVARGEEAPEPIPLTDEGAFQLLGQIQRAIRVSVPGDSEK